MKPKSTLLFFTLPLAGLAAEPSSVPSPSPSAQVSPAPKLTPGTILAAQLREIAATKDLSAPSKRRQVVAAVRLAVTTALTNVGDANEAFALLRELATESARAVPEFGGIIADTVAALGGKSPLFAGRADLLGRLRDAVAEAVEQATAANESAGAEDSGRRRGGDRENDGGHEFGGRKDDVVVSPSK